MNDDQFRKIVFKSFDFEIVTSGSSVGIVHHKVVALFGLIVISLSAQTEIVLNLQHQFDGNDFVMDDAYT
ncbi:MAG: hypothetical protein AAFQ68_04000, partial [Bacteroidota bacterium]